MDTESRPTRRFTLLDGLILIVPMAAGFALARSYVPEALARLGTPDNTARWFRYSGLVVNLASRFAAMGMLAVLAARFLPPRPGLRRISRQPGAVACAAGAAAMAMGGLVVGPLWLFRKVSISSADRSFWPFFEARIFPAVAAAWVALALAGRWRAEPSWVDRAGRALGAYWIALFLYRWVMGLVWPGYWINPS